MKYGVILADPPWKYNFCIRTADNASAHYQVMSVDEICSIPVGEVASDNCLLFLWTTSPKLREAFKVIEAWGFRYVTVAFVWLKQNKTNDNLVVGCGYWTRSNVEICLLGKKGRPKRNSCNVHQIIMSHRRKHSQKPDEQYKLIEELVDGPYLELFARKKWSHKWDVWGDEVNSDIEL